MYGAGSGEQAGLPHSLAVNLHYVLVFAELFPEAFCAGSGLFNYVIHVQRCSVTYLTAQQAKQAQVPLSNNMLPRVQSSGITPFTNNNLTAQWEQYVTLVAKYAQANIFVQVVGSDSLSVAEPCKLPFPPVIVTGIAPPVHMHALMPGLKMFC